MDLLADLTPAQRAAVTHVNGPLLVVAGAGSGKTRVITRRVAHLVASGVAARHVLAITFTNKAAGEMRARIDALLGPQGRDTQGATVSTFHSLCARLLRRFATRVGHEPSFAILDAADQRAAVREALIEVAADPKLFPPPKVAHAIGRAKDRLESPADLAARAQSRAEHVAAKAFEVYQGLLRQRNALDFDDLLTKTVELVRAHPDVREQLQDRFRYVLIDEYQDTNHAQYELARRLTEAHRNLNATGDPDQSIYGWRGADVENILRFEKDYPDAKVVLLENNYRSTQVVCNAANALIKHNKRRKEKTLQTVHGKVVLLENNYRSTQVVCNAANALIKHNKRRKEKTLQTVHGEGTPIEYHSAEDEAAEARWVASKVEHLVRSGTKPDEVAVFYRTNALSRAVEQALFERGVPYVVVGALSFYDRKEVKDVLSWLRVLANPKDDASTLRILQTPPRGIGKTSLSRLKAFAKQNGQSLAQAIGFAEGAPDLPNKARKGLAEVDGILDRLRARLEEASAETLVRAVVEETDYLSYLVQEYPEEDERTANVEALVAGAREFDLRARAAAADTPRPVRPEPPKPAPPQPAPPKARRARPGRDDSPSLFPAPPEPAAPAAEAVPTPALSVPEDEDVLPPLEPGLHGYLEQVALIAEEDARQKDDESEKVSLMTVHTAKGLEFDAVFIVGLEDGLFPNARALDDSPEGLEEERRLAYVAITRARKRLYLTHAGWRARFGRSDPRLPSPFLFELPEHAFEAGRAPRNLAPHGRGASELRWDDDDGEEARGSSLRRRGADDEGDPGLADVEGERPLWSRPVAGSAAPAPRNSEVARAILAGVGERARVAAGAGEELRAGDRVKHEHFGIGRILEVSGSGVGKRVKVLFVEFGEKSLVLQYARLTKVS